MAGTKGRSGGARPGAGRKPKNKTSGNDATKRQDQNDEKPEEQKIADELANSPLMDGQERDPLDFLLLVQNSPLVDPRLRVRAAIAAAQYKHTKTHDGGKKEEKEKAAKKAGQGKFASAAPPKLVVNNK